MRHRGRPCSNCAICLLLRIETLSKTGYIDALTGMPNRSRFNEDMTMWLSLQSTDQHDTALAIDVCGTEYFRNMVKALGWEYAEGYVLATRDRLLQALDGLPAYRIDTTSFAFIVQGNDSAQLAQRCERVCSAFAEVIDHQGIPHAATPSLGAVRLDGALSANHTLARHDHRGGHGAPARPAVEPVRAQPRCQPAQRVPPPGRATGSPERTRAVVSLHTSRGSACAAANASAWRRCCAGSIHCSAASRPTNSFRWRKRPR